MNEPLPSAPPAPAKLPFKDFLARLAEPLKARLGGTLPPLLQRALDGDALPMAIGTFNDVIALLPGTVTEADKRIIRDLLGALAKSRNYRVNLSTDLADRHNLWCEPVEPVAAADRLSAQLSLMPAVTPEQRRAVVASGAMDKPGYVAPRASANGAAKPDKPPPTPPPAPSKPAKAPARPAVANPTVSPPKRPLVTLARVGWPSGRW